MHNSRFSPALPVKRYAAALVLAGAAASGVVAAPASAAPATKPASAAPALASRPAGAPAAAAAPAAHRPTASPALTVLRGWRFHARPKPKPKPVFDIARAARIAAPDGPFEPSAVPYVGPFSPAVLLERMRMVMARNDSGEDVDPFFGSEPDGSWYRDCQHFVAVLDGRDTSGFGSASEAWYHYLAIGAAHPATGADGMRPPVGAWLYYGDNHVVVYLGDNLVAGTDTWGVGTAKIGPASDVQNWLAGEGGYRGWVAP